MSDVFRKSVLNRLPPMGDTKAPWANDGDGEEAEEMEDGMGELRESLPGSSRSTRSQDLSPLSASGFFAQALEVQPPGNDTIFRVYLTPPEISDRPSSSSTPHGARMQGNAKGKGAYLICHHGAGAGGLSFAAMAQYVKEASGGELGVLAFDCRGHGKTRTEGPKECDLDLSLPTLVSDLVGIIQHMFSEPTHSPSFILLGHSMGAAPILSAAPELQKKGYTIPGVVVLDVVEGTAIEALPLMKSILAKRPPRFRSVVDAIHWHLESGTIRDTESARVSVPSLLVPAPDQDDPGPQSRQVWRTDLLATEPYWREWYEGLSNRFLTARCARMLVLAGQERLDKELMVGQMQGKYQLEVMQDVGHYLHEDAPRRLGHLLVMFWRRNTQVLILPPKVGSAPSGPASGVEVKQVGQQ